MFAAKLLSRAAIRNVNAGSIHTTAVKTLFWEKDKKGGFGYKKEQPLMPTKAMILDGLQELKKEINLWREEVTEKFDTDMILVYRPGEVDIAWKFSGLLRDAI